MEMPRPGAAEAKLEILVGEWSGSGVYEGALPAFLALYRSGSPDRPSSPSTE